MIDVHVDSRENKYVHEAFQKNLKRAKYHNTTLPIGDIVVGDFIIERKSINDLYTSIIKGNLFEQLRHMREFLKENECAKIMLLIEKGKLLEENKRYYYMWNLDMIMLNALDEFNIPVKISDNVYDTVKFINSLVSYTNNNKEIIKKVRGFKRKYSLHDKKKYVLMGFETIGDVTSDKILNKYSTLMEYFESLKGKNTKVADILYR